MGFFLIKIECVFVAMNYSYKRVMEYISNFMSIATSTESYISPIYLLLQLVVDNKFEIYNFFVNTVLNDSQNLIFPR